MSKGAPAAADRHPLQAPSWGHRIAAMSDGQDREAAGLREEIARLRRLVEELGASSDKFLAVATHDLRTPLATLRLSVDLLSQPGRVSAHDAHLLAAMSSNVDAMEALVNDVLDASRLSHPGSALNPEEFDLNELVEDTMAGFFPAAVRRELALDAHLSPAVGRVLADRKRLGQALTNLVGNALKFTPSGGTVVVASDGGDDWAEVSVSDTGPGLSEEDKGKLFNSFSRGSAEPAHGDPCTGLGLYITRQIVEAHGGSVGAVGAPGRGSLFYFRIPRRAETAAPEGGGGR